MDHARIFEEIYAANAWHAGSGLGSTEENTRPYRVFLHNFMRANGIRSVLDVGCGDWQFSRHVEWKGIDYLGIDVAGNVLEKTKAEFTRPGVRFEQRDALRDPLPTVDLLLAKDVLQHWSNDDVVQFLRRLPVCRYALLTNGFPLDKLQWVNRDIRTGARRPVDLSKPPFDLPGSYVLAFKADEARLVFLWSNPAYARTEEHSGSLYLDLLKRCLTNIIYGDVSTLGRERVYDAKRRTEGRDWPEVAHTMVGLKRLDNVQFCIEDALARGVPGDLMETGVWRGGTVIFMRAVLKAHGVTDRKVWAADSFEGLPPPDAAKYPLDAGYNFHQFSQLAVSLESVQHNFRLYGLLDDQVRFLKGWFRDTLPSAPVDKLAVLRLDGDLYESTMDALAALYPKVQGGGYVIVDDYADIPACRQAVTDYRNRMGIADEIVPIDWSAVYWKKS